MSRTKEADLVAALYLYASRCWAEGDLPALRDLGFGRREMEDLLSVNLVDLQRLAAVHGQPLQLQVDRAAFRLIVEHLRAERAKEETLRALIRRDAPLPMMEALYGMSGREYTGWRQVLEVPQAVGRPPEPDEATTHRVWRAWQTMLAGREPEEVRPEEYLALQDETEAPLRSMWPLLRRWSAAGGPPEGSGEGGTRKVVPLRRVEGGAEG